MLPKPNSQMKRVIFDLIKKGEVTESNYPYHAFRHYITIIKRSINLRHIDKPFVNSFGRKSDYRVHFITESEKKKATKLYLSLFK